MDSFQILGICQCGRALTTTYLHKTEEYPSALYEAQIVCGSCQAAYRVIVHEETHEEKVQNSKEEGEVDEAKEDSTSG